MMAFRCAYIFSPLLFTGKEAATYALPFLQTTPEEEKSVFFCHYLHSIDLCLDAFLRRFFSLKSCLRFEPAKILSLSKNKFFPVCRAFQDYIQTQCLQNANAYQRWFEIRSSSGSNKKDLFFLAALRTTRKETKNMPEKKKKLYL